ncbi:D-amino-acid oxidase [Coprinopsis cinerea okayama7|uniref:D-amino-acid oxidase n=1 Tax=Coprinopsis cinerea (strain Okayama-7 / 130 / ATCC MYA-4618 / FGSC 9003) TaxID=240176 RepID=A8P5K2_COPC7|nr:D-amino-acid oxidase [Coprinopsis cinerea okayama7\|eukprot:XP_001838962.1 D-amino-acid oxidase [Coprinopsis cinerea okayama7\
MSGGKSIIVLGAGVIGLTTALKIQEQEGYQVTIVAEIFPTDPKSIKYTSQWAGAHHVSFASLDDPRHALDVQTFHEMWKLSEAGEAEGCFMRLQQTEYFGYPRSDPSPLQHMPEFRKLSKEELIEGAQGGETFQTITIDTPLYLNYLLTKFLSRGGKIVRGSVQHLSQLAENGVTPFLEAFQRKYRDATPTPPDAIVVCVGLAARHLGGVEDHDMYPIRGQTVLVRAPWIKFGRTWSQDKTWTYVIPRRSGDVILGGTLGEDDWYPTPRPETTRDILERTLKLCPELVPPNLRKGEVPTVEELLPLVVEEGCGFRPGRKGGLRIEATEIKTSPSSDKKIPVIHNYGHAGSGYIASFGSAAKVVELLNKALGRV